ncbi:MAG: glycoside hydrolase family 3 protein [Lachnospiraceae bacterium]|nr:glycoside hydrolase family 3 protein [Lachnospiraceae bacterium]
MDSTSNHMALNMTLRDKIGQKLVGGFPGKEMSEEFIHMVRTYKIGNVVLFRSNIESSAQLKELCESIQRLIQEETGYPAFIGIDQEGGTVTRLPDDAANVPGAMALAAAGDPAYAKEAAKITACELGALGVNFNFAPVADVNCNPANPVIGVRSFGDDPDQVAKYACASLQGYQENGLLVSAKHFPGHGDTDMDSHVSLPMVDKPLEELERMELKPFQALIDAGCPAIMTTHILFPALEKEMICSANEDRLAMSGTAGGVLEQVPATMSRRIVTGLLKEKMGFQGLVISDCMEMEAIKTYYGTGRGAAEAMKAGVDLILVSHTAELLEEAAQRMETAIANGEMPMEEFDASVEKILAHKKTYCREAFESAENMDLRFAVTYSERNGAKSSSTDQILTPSEEGDGLVSAGCARDEKTAWYLADAKERRKQAQILREKTITLAPPNREAKSVSTASGKLPDLGDNPLFISCPRYQTSQAADAGNVLETFAGFLANAFGLDPVSHTVLTGKDPDEEEIQNAVEAATSHSSVVLGTHNATLYPGQIRLMRAIGEALIPFVVVALGTPYELREVPPGAAGLAAWDYTSLTLEALVPVLAGEKMPEGRMPVRL